MHDERRRAADELIAATSALLSPVHGEDLVAAYQRYERARARIADLTRGVSVGDDDDDTGAGEGDDDDAEG